MRKPVLALFTAAFLIAAATGASAQIFRAYLALDGSDANPCTLPSPCRLLPAALAAVADGGEIWMLDSANYNSGPVFVTKGVTILAVPGALGSVVALGGGALTISTTNDVVLRNLNILPFPGSETHIGVNKQGAGKLALQGCDVSGLSTGLAVGGGASVTVARSTFRRNGAGVLAETGATVGISDSLFADNVNYGAVAGASTTGATTLAVTRSVARANGNGFSAAAGIGGAAARLHVIDSTMEGNTNLGVSIAGPAQSTVYASVTGSLIAGNPTGAFAGGVGDVRLFLSATSIQGNSLGVLQNDSSVVQSAGNNAIRNNVTDVFGTVTIVGGN